MNKKVLCLGDSLTRGSIGFSYVEFLDGDIEAANLGINGDTTAGALARLKEHVGSGLRGERAEVCIIMIGTNDLLLPGVASLSKFWALLLKNRIGKKKCALTDEEFAEKYKELLGLSLASFERTIVVGMPAMQLEGVRDGDIASRNKLLRELADRYGVGFVDARLLQLDPIDRPLREYSWKKRALLCVTDTIVMAVLPRSKDLFSKRRHLELTVDGVHMNRESAMLLARGISKCIKAETSGRRGEMKPLRVK